MTSKDFGYRPSQRLLALASRLDRAGYPWYVRALDTLSGYLVRLGL